MCAGVIRCRLAVDDVEPDVHLGHRAQRLDQRVADQVGEGDLAAAGAGEVVVDDGAVVPQQLDRAPSAPRWRSGRSARRPCSARCAPGRRAGRCSCGSSLGLGLLGGLGVAAARGRWCPWRARRPRRRDAAWRPGPAWRTSRRRASRPASRQPSAGAAPASAARPSLPSSRAALAGAPVEASGRASARGGRLGRTVGAAAVLLEVRRPLRPHGRRDPSGTGRTSPRRASRWLRSLRGDCSEKTQPRLGSPLPGAAWGSDGQVSRLNPSDHKCRQGITPERLSRSGCRRGCR